MLKFTLSVLLICFMIPGLAYAHGGGTDAEGCHTDKATGKRHCHDKKKKQSQSSKKKDSSKKASSQTTLAYSAQLNGKLFKIDYPGYTVWLDCVRRGAVKFRYNAQRDSGNEKRHSQFYHDPDVPDKCQQTSTKAYGSEYDRGHLVPANHLDYSKIAIKKSNMMTNILPQKKEMNRGAWKVTEEITECYRDIDELLILGGVIWGNDSTDDYFKKSHGVETPDAFWKFIIRGRAGDERVNAWIVPNVKEAIRKNLDKYLVAPVEIEKITGEKLPVPEYLRYKKPKSSWLIPKGCNRS